MLVKMTTQSLAISHRTNNFRYGCFPGKTRDFATDDILFNKALDLV